MVNDVAMDLLTLLDLEKTAVLLDVDGTIVDIGPSPTEVQLAAGLPQTLKRLFDLTSGALALVSGRRIGDLRLGNSDPFDVALKL